MTFPPECDTGGHAFGSLGGMGAGTGAGRDLGGHWAAGFSTAAASSMRAVSVQRAETPDRPQCGPCIIHRHLGTGFEPTLTAVLY